jgi:cytochrome c2
LAPRLAILIAPALLWLVGCVRADLPVAKGGGCIGCHASHYQETGSCTSCHRGDPDAGRQALAHHRLLSGGAADHGRADAPPVVEGRKLLESLACHRCHQAGGVGNRLATNLDRIVWTRDQSRLAHSIADPVENMPRFGLSARQIDALIAFLLHSADSGTIDATYRVRFARRESDRGSRFEDRCGGCHRALLAEGPQGRGSAGPNLSGLFTGFYPTTAPKDRSWTPAALERWLLNPRALRPATTMRPLHVDRGEWRRLLDELGGALTVPSRPGHENS